MIIGLSSICSTYDKIETFIDAIIGYGFNSIEVVGNDHRIQKLSLDELGNKLAVARDKGIHIQYHQALFQHSDGYIYSVDDFCRLNMEEATKKLNNILTIAEKISAESVITHMGSMKKDGNKTETLKKFARTVKNVLPRLEETGIKLCVENMYQYKDYTGYPVIGIEPAEFLQFFEIIDNPHVGLNLDIGHANVSHTIDEFLETLDSKIFHVHLADNHGKRDEHLAVGMGLINWNKVIGNLVNKNFNGPYILEYSDKYLPDTIDKVKRLLK